MSFKGWSLKKTIFGIASILLIINLLMLAPSIQPAQGDKTWTVDDDEGLADFQRIQEAIDAASDGDIINVFSGTYHENIIVNKTDLSLIGEDQNSTIIEDGGTGTVLKLTASNVTVTSFTIQGLHSNDSIGIHLHYSENNTLSNNILKNLSVGVKLVCSNNNKIENNILLKNGIGIELWNQQSGNVITENTVVQSGTGISLLAFSNHSKVSRNIVSENDIGIRIFDSGNNIVKENIISESLFGIYLDDRLTRNNLINGNMITKNDVGIYSFIAKCNTIYNNNIIKNEYQVKIPDARVNKWNSGYPLGGNYWSNYEGEDRRSGINQTEIGSDGIGDVSLFVWENNQDFYPLMGPINIFEVDTLNGAAFDVNVIANSTVSNFQFNETEEVVSFDVACQDGTTGFCRVIIPNAVVENLWQNHCRILVDGEPLLDLKNWTDNTNTYFYFEYLCFEHRVIIITEFRYFTLLLLFMLLSSITILISAFKRKHR